MTNETISYGETLEDAQYTAEMIQDVIAACEKARKSCDPVTAGRELYVTLLTCSTLLGLAPLTGTAIETLHAALVAARDAEGAESERILTSGGSKRDASVHSGRRGVLDTARYEIEQATEYLERLETELAAWDARKKTRGSL